MFKRSSGILFHPTSLPGKYGIGTLGKKAFEFVDFLAKAKQQLWQIFPLGPTGYGDSPYQSFSTFAGNPYLIDFDLLIEGNLLQQSDLEGINFGNNEECIDYGLIYNEKYPLLRKAYENFKKLENNPYTQNYNDFKWCNGWWLEDYAMYIALKNHFNGLPWNEWPADIKARNHDAMEKYRWEIGDDIEFHRFIQFLFFTQWNDVKEYANNKGIKIIGDIPIFVAADSADAWANPEIFLFDEDRKPVKVAGVPPDYFSATGQLWGNPLFDWDKLKETGYKWWIDRVKANLSLYDIIRIDHFRGFESYWSINYGEETAINGKWEKGPGMDLFNAIRESLGDLNIIAEDLGTLTDDVVKLKNDTGFPGMRILQFAFSQDPENEYLPHNYDNNTVVYTGTHDNDTTNSWFSNLNDIEKQEVREYINVYDDNGIVYGLIRAALSSVADIAIIPMQDYLNLGGFARINTPGLAAGNWQWRLKNDGLSDELAKTISHLTEIYGR